MIKIAYDSTIFSDQTYGGISRYFCELASRISILDGVNVKIAAPMYKNKYLPNLPKAIINGFSSPFPQNFMAFHQRAASLCLGDIILRCISPDIIHETYCFRWPLGPRRAARVITIHDMIHEKFKSSFPDNDQTSKYKALAAHRADHIICISESTKRDVIEILGISPKKISVIHLGFDLMTNDEISLNEYFNSNKKPYILFVGNRDGYKNFQTLLKAYAASSILRQDFNLVCFGGGKFTNSELALFEELGLLENQTYQYSGDDQQLAAFYTKASVFVYPSLYEGFGIPPLEAMAHGCPVVCSNTSSIPEVVASAGVYFDPASIESMRNAIESLVSSPMLRTSIIEAGKVRLNSFSWDRCAKETLAIYKKLK